MAAFMIVMLRNRDAQWMADYVTHVPGILRKYGGEYVGVSKRIKQLEGIMPIPDGIAILRFPSAARIEEFMACEEYRPYRELRQGSSAADILIFDAAPAPSVGGSRTGTPGAS